MTHPRGFMHCHEDFVGSDEIKLYISQLVEDSDLGRAFAVSLALRAMHKFIRMDKTFQIERILCPYAIRLDFNNLLSA